MRKRGVYVEKTRPKKSAYIDDPPPMASGYLSKPLEPVSALQWPYKADFWDQYTDAQELGEGVSGTVYQVIGPDERDYAVKIFNKPPENETEMRVLQALSSECDWFIKYVGTYTVPDRVWKGRHVQALLMDYFEGSDADEANLTAEQLPCLLKQLLRALACMHGIGLVHRDIKPSNVRVSSDGKQAVLVDFGLACQEHETFSVDSCKTHVLGTKIFLAPESEYGQTDKTDIYALGLTFWVLLHPEQVPPGQPETINDVRDFAFELIGSLPVPADNFEVLLQRMVSADPEARPTALEALGDPALAHC
jgi:serine/threonine protein kinase